MNIYIWDDGDHQLRLIIAARCVTTVPRVRLHGSRGGVFVDHRPPRDPGDPPLIDIYIYINRSFTSVQMCHTHTLPHTEAFTHRSFYAQRFSHGSFTQRSFYTEKRLNRASFIIHRSIYTHKSFTYAQSFYTQTLLRIEACSQSLQTKGLTQRGLYTEQLLHTDAFTQRCTEQLLHADAPRLLRTEVFTHKLYTDKLLHTEASTQHL